MQPHRPNALLRAVSDLFWTFFPVFILVLILALLGRLAHLAERTDLILCAAVLFAEGWSRLRRQTFARRSALEFWGFIGALVTVVLASVMLLVEVGHVTQLESVTSSTRFLLLHNAMLALSVVYGVAVRLKGVFYEDMNDNLLHDLIKKNKSAP